MKKNLLFALLVCSLSGSATGKTVFEQISAVNSNWNRIGNFTPLLEEVKDIHGEVELIQTHLDFVISYLESRNLELDAHQLANRELCIDHLRAYREKGIFPINNHHTNRQPYFIDDIGNYCAVGYLLKETGFNNTALQIHKEMNYAYVREIPIGYLKDWAYTYGFTVDELALIQPTYSPGLFLRDDTIYVGRNTVTICPVFVNDFFSVGGCSSYNLLNPTLTIIDSPSRGNLIVSLLPTDTTIIYMPDSNYVGADSFSYEIIYGGFGLCGLIRDTARVLLNVLTQSGNFISYTAGDANFDGVVSHQDVLLLAKNMGEQGIARNLNNGPCAATYSLPWNTSFAGFNAAACDEDGNGLIDSTDFDIMKACMGFTIHYTNGGLFQNPQMEILPYDTVLTAGDRVDVKFFIKDSSGLIPIKAIAVTMEQNLTPRIFLVGAAIEMKPVVNNSIAIAESYSKPFDIQYWGRYVASACFAIAPNQNNVFSCLVSDTFTLRGLPIVADSIHSNGNFSLRLSEIVALDNDDNLIRINPRYILFRADQTTSIPQINSTAIHLYPNPASDNITISIDDNLLGSTATLTDLTGRRMMAVQLSTVNRQLSTADFTSGVYFVTVTASDARLDSGQGRSVTKKLVISR
jgi:hypothetical protein